MAKQHGRALGSWYYFIGRPEWQTMVFTFLVFAQEFKALIFQGMEAEKIIRRSHAQ